MLFNSFAFLVFLAIVLPVYYALSHRRQNLFLLAASYVFYGYWDWRFLGLLAASTLIDYAVSCGLGRTDHPLHRRVLLGLSIAANLGLLAAFKFFNFFLDNLNVMLGTAGFGELSTAMQLVVPVGISFYTFQTLGYTIDVYRRRQAPADSIIDFALFVSYFPQLVAGPIERASRLLPRICSTRVVRADQIASALQLILMGYLKKIAIADAVAPHVERIFGDPGGCSSVDLVLGLYLFAIQIYGDFSGYSDIARGVSRLFGIELMENFRQPYLSANITEFWRRWHISLSGWLRDYLYIPLGGNRHGSWATYRNLMLVMLIGGLWHGAAWTFVIWGGLHGVFLCVHRLWTGQTVGRAEHRTLSTGGEHLRYLAGVVLTFHLVCFAWLFFRAPSFTLAGTYVQGLVALDFNVELRLAALVVLYGALTLLIDLPCWAFDRETPLTPQTAWPIRGLAQAAAIALISFVGAQEGATFIYFQF